MSPAASHILVSMCHQKQAELCTVDFLVGAGLAFAVGLAAAPSALCLRCTSHSCRPHYKHSMHHSQHTKPEAPGPAFLWLRLCLTTFIGSCKPYSKSTAHLLLAFPSLTGIGMTVLIVLIPQWQEHGDFQLHQLMISKLEQQQWYGSRVHSGDFAAGNMDHSSMRLGNKM